MANVRAEAAQRRVLVQPDTVEGPPETPLAINSTNYQRVLNTITTYAAEMIHMSPKELESVIEDSVRSVMRKRGGGLTGTKAAPKFFGPTVISLHNAWGEDAATFKYTTVFWISSVINKNTMKLPKD